MAGSSKKQSNRASQRHDEGRTQGQPSANIPVTPDLNAPIYTPDVFNYSNQPIDYTDPNIVRNLGFDFFLTDPQPPPDAHSHVRSSSHSSQSISTAQLSLDYFPLGQFPEMFGTAAQPEENVGLEDLNIDTQQPDEEEEERFTGGPIIREGVHPARKQGGRGPMWRWKQDQQLINSWLNVSKDATCGTDQSGATFWDKVRYHACQFDPQWFQFKTHTSVKGRWGKINKAVTAFSGLYNTEAGRKARSGENEDDVISRTIESWDRLYGKFEFLPHWQILRHEEKWQSYQADPLHKSFETRKVGRGGSQSESSGKRSAPSEEGDSGEAAVGPTSSIRPEGREAAKKARASKGKKKVSYAEAETERLSALHEATRKKEKLKRIEDVEHRISKIRKARDRKQTKAYDMMAKNPDAMSPAFRDLHYKLITTLLDDMEKADKELAEQNNLLAALAIDSD